jgi:hypothetical protein
VSSRHTRSFFGVMLAVVFALSAVVVAPASAKLSKHQKAHIRKQLKRAIKKNPKLIRSKHFIKKASLVDFVLPVTIKLRGFDSPTDNPNHATIDLGASLGKREIDLGGTLKAEIKFHDSFDGGALGNVDLDLRQGGALTTTSIPLLWNTQTSAGNWWAAPGSPIAGAGTSGCGDFLNSNAAAVADAAEVPGGPASSLTATPLAPHQGIPVYAPAFDPTNPLAHIAGFAGEYPGVDSLDNLTSFKVPGDPNNLGGTQDPFPSALDPTGPGRPAGIEDTVLRTGPITLGVAQAGLFNESNAADGLGPQGSQNITVGKSGGQANLFGNIPGKTYGIDVTASLSGTINSIIRQVDSDFAPLEAGQKWPSAAFQCRQAWTGGVQNLIQDVHLTGDLNISPAITKDGDLRIAKATLRTQVLNGEKQLSRVALGACLAPYATFADQKNSSDGSPVRVPSLAAPPASYSPPFGYPIDEGTARTAPSAPCNGPATQLLQDAGVGQLSTPDADYSTSRDGSQVSVAGDLEVNEIDADVIIGDVS